MQSTKPRPTHREVLPVRECSDCGAYLASANEDDYCACCGGFSTQRLSQMAAVEAGRDFFAEMMEVA